MWPGRPPCDDWVCLPVISCLYHLQGSKWHDGFVWAQGADMAAVLCGHGAGRRPSEPQVGGRCRRGRPVHGELCPDARCEVLQQAGPQHSCGWGMICMYLCTCRILAGRGGVLSLNARHRAPQQTHYSSASSAVIAHAGGACYQPSRHASAHGSVMRSTVRATPLLYFSHVQQHAHKAPVSRPAPTTMSHAVCQRVPIR